MQTIASEIGTATVSGHSKLDRDAKDPAIEARIREFVARDLLFSENGYPLKDEDSFMQNRVIDSLGVLELVAFASREFRVQIASKEITPENFDSVRRFADYIRRKKTLTSEDIGVTS
jgi:acyl carrier protein